MYALFFSHYPPSCSICSIFRVLPPSRGWQGFCQEHQQEFTPRPSVFWGLLRLAPGGACRGGRSWGRVCLQLETFPLRDKRHCPVLPLRVEGEREAMPREGTEGPQRGLGEVAPHPSHALWAPSGHQALLRCWGHRNTKQTETLVLLKCTEER